MSNHHNIVFTGRILGSFSPDDVRREFAKLFRLADPALLDRIFSGKRVLLHKGLSATEAQQRCEALRAIGADCEVSAEQTAPTPTPSTTTAAASGAVAARVVDEPAATVNPPPSTAAPARLELGYAGARPPRSHHEEEMRQKAAERAAQYEPRFTVTQDTAAATMDPLTAPWDPHFFPECARGLSWGGFFAPLLWGTFNGLRLSFLPALGLRFLRHWVPAWAWIVFYLAFGAFYLVYGREMAWEHKSWRNADHFIRVQRYWAYGSVVFFVLVMSGLGHLAIQDHQRARLEAAATQYAAAITAAQQMSDSAGRAAATRNARETYLAAVKDPVEQSRLQQQFHDEDAEENAREAENAEPETPPANSGSDSNDSPPSSE